MNASEKKDKTGTLAKRTEAARIFFESKECVMTGEYVNTTTPVEYTCHCGKEGCKATLRTAKQRGWGGCRDCATKQMKATNKERYGNEHVLNVPKFKAKSDAVMLEKFGVTNALKAKEIREKKGRTMKEKYGVEHSLQKPEFVEKARQTSMKRFGVENVLLLPENQEKGREKLKEKFGDSGPLGDPKIRKRRDDTMMEKYGSKHALQCEKFKLKFIETCRKRFGVDHHSQNDEVYSRILKSSFGKKKFVFPSGRTVDYQGYEHFGILVLLSEGIEEDDVVSCHEEMRRFWYFFDGKNHKYLPDIHVLSKNLYVEVKSTFTFGEVEKNEEEKTYAKLAACREAGFNTRLLILGTKGEIIQDEYEEC